MSKDSKDNSGKKSEDLNKNNKGNESNKKTKKSNKDGKSNSSKKKGYFLPKTAFDWACDLIILACIVVMIVLIVPPTVKNIKNKMELKKTEKALKEAKENATPEPTATAVPENIAVYMQNIESSGETNDTTFTLEFNVDDKTFVDRVTAGTMSDSLDEGEYEKTESGIKTISSEDNKETKYILDGNYLVVKDSLYEGTIPEGADKTFKKEFTYKNEETLIYRQLTFKLDGTFELVRAALNEDFSVDFSNSSFTSGSYELDGNLIHLEEESDGSALLDYYVYDGKITNAYYKKYNGPDLVD
ncbi:MAG: hypothetical protein K6G11_07420 [Lachnospiraceae bacterium]|nr:hypothetical protein [Lachnospiraceae bacterium]